MGRGPSLEWLSSLDVPDCGWSWWMIRSSIDGQAVVLAALLHDVGKFWQRTGAPSPPTYASFDRTDYGAHGAHAKWSAACYEEIIPLTWRRGAHDVLTHHRPVNYSAKIVALADHLAASERDDREADDATPETARLIPVFARIHAAADLDRTARELAAYAAARLNFDWEGAWKVADAELPRAALGDRRLLERLREEAQRLSDRADPALFLGERFHRARVAYAGHAYSEFLTLLVALEEAALREIARRELGIDVDEDTPKARERRRRQVAERPDLQRFLEAKMVDGQPLDYTRANRAALLAYLEYLARPGAPAPTGEAGSPSADLAEVYRLVTRVDRGPAAARNRSVHRDGGASRAQIEALYNPPDQERRDLIDDLRTLTCRASGRVDDWALDQIRATLLARLRS